VTPRLAPARSSRSVLTVSLGGLAIAALALAGCSTGSSVTATSAEAAQSAGTSVSGPGGSPGPSVATSPSLNCANDMLTTKVEHLLTVGTDKPAYPPYFEDNKPANGKGFESAVAYAVAKQLGFDNSHVRWITVPFDSSYQPGTKAFDFDINEISVTAARAKVVDFSHGYYGVNQAIVALKGGKADGITTIAGLKKLKFGVQVGTTSYSALKDFVKPGKQPSVFNTSDAATSALKNKQIDAIVVDLPTAEFIAGVELKGGEVVGQFSPSQGGGQFGLLLEKGSTLLPCVNKAIDTITASGELKTITDKWLADWSGVVTFK
jgi:polar amino acid transport system substrate-binding protein